MESLAVHRFARISARKARLVVDLVRKMPVRRAMDTLQHSTKKAAKLVQKVLGSAIANADNRFPDVDLERLYVCRAFVDEGPSLKRTMPRAKGRGNAISKYMSHITVVVSDERER